ncbi:hypothetical protein [Reticulibacter mediterranei]|nr:hypothetical protein [Reticulibacter mediterranei]
MAGAMAGPRPFPPWCGEAGRGPAIAPAISGHILEDFMDAPTIEV